MSHLFESDDQNTRASSSVLPVNIQGWSPLRLIWEILFLGGSKITADGDCSHEIKRYLLLGRKAMTNLDSILKSKDNKGLSSQSYGLSSSHVWMWELDYKESWTRKNGRFWTVALEKTREALDCKEIKPINPKRNQSWIFIGRTDAEAPILWPPDTKNWLIGKDPDAGKDCRREEKRATEDEMVGWHHRLNGHEFEQALGVGDRQGSLACCNPWSHRVRHNWATELKTDLFDLLAVQGTSGVFSSTTVWKHRFFGILPSLQSSSHSHTWPLGRL